jgi:hypothetical protein
MRNQAVVLILGVTLISIMLVGFPLMDNDESEVTEQEKSTFQEVSSSKGINYTTNNEDIESGGVFILDYNADNWPDILVIGGDKPLLYENTGGRFVPANELPPIEDEVKTAVAFDYNLDGWEDLLLLRVNNTPILLANNHSKYHAVDVGFDTQISMPKSAAVADFDRNGCPDVFIAQNADWDNRTPLAARFSNFREEINGSEDNGNPNYLYQSNCSKFTLSANSNIRGKRWTLATSFIDLTGDGWPDIHTANDFNNDVIYINQMNGTFRAKELDENTDRNAMSSEITDVNGDGQIDIFVTNIYLPPAYRSNNPRLRSESYGNNLLINDGQGHFQDAADEYGVQEGGWGWAAVFADFDNDGDPDLFHTTSGQSLPFAVKGNLREQGVNNFQQYLAKRPYLEYPVLWERTSSKFKLLNSSRTGFRSESYKGAADLDFDLDGDIDLVVASSEGHFRLYENTLKRNRALTIVFDNATAALGTRVYVTANGKTQMRVLNSKADFLSQDSRALHFGLGSVSRVARIRIVEQNGDTHVLREEKAGNILIITHNGSITERIPYRT